MTDPKYKIPLLFHGWIRELVYRSKPNRAKADVYYYTPKRLKFRSMNALSNSSEFKKSQFLSAENFVFFPEPIGIGDPEKEIIRNAKPRGKKASSKSGGGKETPRVLGPKVASPNPSTSKVDQHSMEVEPHLPAPPQSQRLISKKNPAKQTPQKTVESPRLRRRAIKFNNVTANDKHEEPKFMDSYLQNLAYRYNTLLYVFQYLNFEDLLRARCVCRMWRNIASDPSLWRTVRIKNSQVLSFEGLANTLQKHGTVHFDLRKMLLPTNVGDDFWPEFSKAIQKVQTLRKIECKCPASVVEQLAVTNKDIEVINAVTITCESMSLDLLFSLRNLKEVRLKSTSRLTLSSDITSLKELTNLKHLSLTSIKDLNKMNLNVISVLKNLESLDLGECTDFPENFGDILIELKSLGKLRLEKGQGNCYTFEILEAVRKMPHLEQLELVNFDVKTGFDVALGGCKNIRKLLIIPTYISQCATTNHLVLGGVLKLQGTLSLFLWCVTVELLRVMEFVGNGDSIAVLKPVPLEADTIPPAHDPPQIEVLPLPDIQNLLLRSLPTTRVKILKIPFHATWRQSITDTVN